MWFDRFLSIYKSRNIHEFILYFNIRDMVDNYRYIDRYIYDEFIKQRGFSIVAFYDISRALVFWTRQWRGNLTKLPQMRP